MADMRLKENKTLLQTVRDRHKIMTEADHENRQDAIDDLRFVNIPGEMWDSNMKQERGDRPCYEYNKTKIRCKRVINDIRDNRPAGKTRAVEGGDTETAEIYEGLIRNIWNVSHGDNATDYAAEYQVEGGMGAWRINTEFSDDTAFNQDIVIQAIENPFTLYGDPAAKEFMRRDADDWILTERISHKEYETKYGKTTEKVDFEGDSQFDTKDDWWDDKTVRVVEYWYKVPHTKELWLMDRPNAEDPELIESIVVDSESDEGIAIAKDPKLKALITRTRTVKTSKIMMCIASGEKILEGPVEWAGHIFPFVMVYGEYKVIDGKRYWWGLVRNAKDAQRNYNISKTNIAETIAQAPKAKWWATPKQAEGLVDQWAESHKKNFPWNLYNVDKDAPGPPQRMGAADVPVALMQQAAIDDADLKDVMGVPDENVGQQTNASSGRAIFARQQQGEIANFNFKDNMAKGVELTHEILIDLIPEIYDTERELRILGADGVEDYKRVNQVVFDKDSGKSIRLNDLAVGKYDVTITIGPAFSTLRQESVEIYGELGRQFPQLMAVAGDLIFKSMDLPYADDIADRLRTMLPPEIKQMLDSDTEVPPEIQNLMQQAQQAMAQVQEHGQLVQAASDELDGEKALNDKQKAEIKTELANVKTAVAEFDAHIAQELLKLVQKETSLITTASNVAMKGAEVKEAAADFGRKIMSETVDVAGSLETVTAIDDILAKFMQSVDQAMAGLEQKAGELQTKTDRKVVGGIARREGGRLTATVDFDDGTSKSLSVVRDGGNLTVVPDTDNSEGS